MPTRLACYPSNRQQKEKYQGTNVVLGNCSIEMRRDHCFVRWEVWNSHSSYGRHSNTLNNNDSFGNTSSNMPDTSRWMASDLCFAEMCVERWTLPLVCSVRFTELCMRVDVYSGLTWFWLVSGLSLWEEYEVHSYAIDYSSAEVCRVRPRPSIICRTLSDLRVSSSNGTVDQLYQFCYSKCKSKLWFDWCPGSAWKSKTLRVKAGEREKMTPTSLWARCQGFLLYKLE